MPYDFQLSVKVAPNSQQVELILHDADGVYLASHQVDFADGQIDLGQQRALFDLQKFVRHYTSSEQEQAALTEVGVVIAEQVLGKDVFKKLYASQGARTMRIVLPGAGADVVANPFVAALARIPWEIARPSADKPNLGERNLHICIELDHLAAANQPIALPADGDAFCRGR